MKLRASPLLILRRTLSRRFMWALLAFYGAGAMTAFIALAVIRLLRAGTSPRGQGITALQALASDAGQLLVLALACGATAMTAIETFRRLIPIRGMFHQAALAAHLGDGYREVVLAAGRGATWYDVPLENLVA